MRTTDDGRKRLRFDFRVADTHPESECECPVSYRQFDLAQGYDQVRVRPFRRRTMRQYIRFHSALWLLLLIPVLLNLCLVERSQVTNPAAHKFVDDVIRDDAVGIAFAGHFEDMPLSAIRAAQNFHRTEFLDNVEKAKTYAARAAESRKIADRAFTAMTKIIAILDPTDLSEEERIVQAKYREINDMILRLDINKPATVVPSAPPAEVPSGKDTDMAPPEHD
jgi:hypothetical protein